MNTSDDILVSVIIPVYNEEQYLVRCLDSVANQTLKNIEVICVNDGSLDNSINIIKNFATSDERFKLINQENKGISISRNVGLNQARGKYIFFLDADDYILPQTLDCFYQTAINSDCPIVISSKFHRTTKYFPSVNKSKTSDFNFKICNKPLRDLYKHRLVSAVVWNKLYRTDVVKNFSFIEGIYYEDWPFTTCVFANIEKFALINEKLYVYNTSSSSIVRSQFTIKKIRDYIYGIRYVYNYFQQKHSHNKWKVVRKKRIACSIKMILSKITKTKINRHALEAYFKSEYSKLVNDKIITFSDLTLKSKFRLLRLIWHLRQSN